MALTYSPEGSLGSSCPEFNLKSVDGRNFTLGDFQSQSALVIMFICNHCPYVQAIEDRLIALAGSYDAKKVGFIGICSNDPTDHPSDSPAELLKRWKEKQYGFPYLIDTDQSVARAFGAVCTPDLYVYDSDRQLRYRGRLDDSWKNPAHVQKQELRDAVDSLVGGRSVTPQQNPSIGCSIKWQQ